MEALEGIYDLIDTLWNVKGIKLHSQHLQKPDLIDTLWNVKYSQFVDRSTGELDLIDTLWNVKTMT